jgi:hypothetical protein
VAVRAAAAARPDRHAERGSRKCMFACGPIGATVKKNGLPDLTASSSNPKDFCNVMSVVCLPGYCFGCDPLVDQLLLKYSYVYGSRRKLEGNEKDENLRLDT